MLNKNVCDLATGDSNGKQKLIGLINRVMDMRRGAADALAAAAPAVNAGAAAAVEDEDL